MADEENKEVEEEAGAEAEGVGGKKPAVGKRVIIVAVFFVVLLGVQIGLAIYIGEKFIKKENKAKKAMDAADKKSAEEKRKNTSMGLTLPEPIEVTVNILGTDGSRYAVLGVQLEWEADYIQMQELLDARMPKIKDIIIRQVSSRPLSEMQTSEGKRNITETIKNDVNLILPEPSEDKSSGGIIRTTFLDKFLIQ